MEFVTWGTILLMVVGFFAGFMNVIAGGGSTLSVPVMIFMGLPAPVANGTNRIAILAQNITAVITFFRQGYSDFRLSLSLAICAIPGALAGALIGVEFSGVWFNRMLAVIMFAIMVINYLDIKPVPNKDIAPSRNRLIIGHLMMTVVGFWGGFIQIGVGFLVMPILSSVIGLDLVRTNMHKVFIIGTYTVIALAVFADNLDIPWIIGLALALGNMLGGYLGARISISQGDSFIRLILNVVLACFIVRLLIMTT